ncbi:FKBP-type peptidyl-prolyl cis-trans isomerase [Salinibacterium sp. GXW1014]|uniref:FKBP-type peptidyl-prolyl cis-trans isomerase n=1 Tax=Salinibacterium sp. GXW1014 TaxID=3377838 RepID=UPI00383AA897
MRAARRLALVATLSATAILLAGCQTPPEPDENAPGCAPENASLGVSAEGELFLRPEVSFDTPLRPLTTERLVLVEGDGRVAVPGSLVTVEFVAFNGATGEPVEASGYGAAGVGHTVIPLDLSSATPGVRRALLCSTAGSRVAAVVHPEDAVGQRLVPGLGADDPLVYVFDIVSVAAEVADGEPQEIDPALPTVDDSLGVPVVTVPDVPAPTELVSVPALLGDGPVVRAGADVTIRYRSVLWRNGLTVEENWSALRPERIALSELLPGVEQGLIGASVGSRVVIVVPPSLGYGPGGDVASSVTGTDTLVWVVDVLATT